MLLSRNIGTITFVCHTSQRLSITWYEMFLISEMDHLLSCRIQTSTLEPLRQKSVQRLADLIRLLHRAPMARVNNLDRQIRQQSSRPTRLDERRQSDFIPLAPQKKRRHRNRRALLRKVLLDLVMVVMRQRLVRVQLRAHPAVLPNRLKPLLFPTSSRPRVRLELDAPVLLKEAAHRAAHTEHVAHPVLAGAVHDAPQALEAGVEEGLRAVVVGEELPVRVPREAGGLLRVRVEGVQVERRRHRRDVGDVEHGHARHQRWVPQPQALRDRRAPVMPDGDDLARLLGGQQLGDVGGDGARVVERRRVWLGALAVAELVDGDDAVGEAAQVREDVLPKARIVGEAVDEE